MRRATCARLFEAEAMRDGRLTGDQLTSFARHTTGCAACRREVQAFEALADVLRVEAGGGAPADELHHLRERTRLIAAFDATLVAPDRRRPAWRWGWGAAAALVLMAAAGAVLRGRGPDGPKTGPIPAVIVQASAATAWTKSSEGARDRIVLERGDLWIRVDHSRQETRLVVALPDGELEDTGTTFTVSAAEGRTTRVAVQEGSVSLRLTGRPAVTIGGGQTWRAAPSPSVLPVPATTARVPAPAERRPRDPLHASPAPITLARRDAAPTAAAVPAAGESNAAVDFRAAVAVLDGGDNREAAAAFGRFLMKHAHDPRAEDAAYLRVVALRRAGAAEEARRFAQTYLQLFPRGFRRTEIEPLAR